MSNVFLVTIKLPRNPKHNPQNKIVGRCPFSDECTDSTGEHHTGIVSASEQAVVEMMYGPEGMGHHITRIEKMK